MRKNTHPTYSRAFTIVELLIVIVVIAILAVIITVAYGGIQKKTTQSVLQTTAREVAKAMEVRKVDLGLYPVEIPNTVTTPAGTGIGVTLVADSNSYCFNITTTRYDDVVYSIDQTQVIKDVLCPGQVVATKGDYNAAAGGGIADSWLTASTVGKSVAPGDMGFTVETNETWSQLTLSWKAMSGATQYRINHRDSPTGTWYVRNATGASGYSADSSAYSGNIASSTTSIVWTASIPTLLDQTHDYKIQYKKADGTWSEWQQVSLSPMTGRTLPTIRNFKVTPNTNWSSIAFTWDSIGNFAKLPNVKFRINQRSTPNGTWYVRNPATSAGFGWDNTVYSGVIAPTDTSATWTGIGSIPPDAASVYEYRIQLYSGSLVSDWSTYSLNPLEGTTLPKINNFTVTPNADWSTVTFNWAGIGNYASLPNVKFRINQRSTPNGTWYVRNPATSAGFGWDNISYSGSIPPTDTSSSWTGTGAIPPDASSVYEYRIQAYSGAAQGEWTTVSLNPLAGTTLPKVANFKVVPSADWSSITLSWDSIGNFAKLPNVKFRINQRSTPNGTWYVRNPATSGGYGWDSTVYSGSVAPTDVSSVWTAAGVIPTSGATYEYRIQPYSGSATGEWAAFSLSR